MMHSSIRYLRDTRACHNRRAVAGFTLIELMIVVAIVGILVTVAIASYEFAVTKTRRGAAKGCLMQNAQYMERFYTTNMAYDEDTSGTAVSLPGCDVDVTPFYNVSFSGTPAAASYTIQAAPISGKQNDSKCGTLTIDQVGTKGASGTGGVAACW